MRYTTERKPPLTMRGLALYSSHTAPVRIGIFIHSIKLLMCADYTTTLIELPITGQKPPPPLPYIPIMGHIFKKES